MIPKPLLVSTYDLSGGAARAAHRLHLGLLTKGIDSTLLVQRRTGDSEGVVGPTSRRARALARVRPVIDSSVLAMYPNRPGTMMSPAWLPGGASSRFRDVEYDLINLHWTVDGFLSVSGAGTIQKPIIWTLHDMWIFTGGCHYSGQCDGYREKCGRCPQLGSSSKWDLSRLVMHQKERRWRGLDLSLVSPTEWLAEAARNSSLLSDCPITVISNGVDTKQFRPFNREFSREVLGLPAEKGLVAFGALNLSERRKGATLLLDAIGKLAERIPPETVELVIFGSSKSPRREEETIKATYLGALNDDVGLALLFSAVDVVVVPSLYEAQSLVAVEAMACGTPCVAFRVEGLSEVINHGQNGLLATAFDTSELADLTAELLTNQNRRTVMAAAAREKALREWDLGVIANRYVELFQSLITSTG